MPYTRTLLTILLAATIGLSAIGICALRADAAKRTPTQKELKNRRADAQHRMEQASTQIDKNDAAISKALAEVHRLDADIADTRSKLDSLTQLSSELQNQSSVLQNTIDRTRRELDTLRAVYMRQIKQMRLHRGETSGLAFLFSSSDFYQGLQRWRYMKQLARWRNHKAAAIQTQLDLLGKHQIALQSNLAARTAATSQTRMRHSELAAAQKQQQLLASQLRADNRGLQRVVVQKRREIKELDQQTASLIASAERRRLTEAAKAKATSKPQAKPQQTSKPIPPTPSCSPKTPAANTSASKPTATAGPTYAETRGRRPRHHADAMQPAKSENQPLTPTPAAEPSAVPAQTESSGFATQQGKLPHPVKGTFRITLPYGRHSRPDMPKVELDNTGIDAEVSPSAHVLAVYQGQVAAIYRAPGFGTVVLLRHGEYYTVYANLGSVAVSTGQNLKQGQMLGTAAAGENPTLHFEVWRQRVHLNPQNWLR